MTTDLQKLSKKYEHSKISKSKNKERMKYLRKITIKEKTNKINTFNPSPVIF